MDATEIYNHVNDRYSSFAKGSSDAKYGAAIAKAFGYSEEELAGIPQDANLGLSCGNPLVMANLREGETVIDLGSGAGFDVFQAAKKVGAAGKAIGVDMNKDMLARANRNKETVGAANVAFIESPITKIDLPASTADCIISNCVINLVPENEKHVAFEEMFRLLKPGGRVAISDILAKKALPDALKKDVALYVGCISGASQAADYERYLREAGFKGVAIVDTNRDLDVYTQTQGNCPSDTCCSAISVQASCCEKTESTDDTVLEYLSKYNLNDWAGSFQIYAIKA
ncbi:hypothetical protein W97_00924 [Coniosporium apollinis CBS 100218]|uniref:Arsenite methyltransferase n=1 Tax=Coniosporium apollinis (strain CBS 100218) TaxID=1168221 RepID=R7YIJ6_CONA1|nr:uncharacterized protein W97_00924 [Coniosporium apollinis CBS 100218]EON61708.1 hypothetical protein W97_00924 [Coniosporium apollinis CBS 100218]